MLHPMKSDTQSLGRITVERHDRRVCGLAGVDGTEGQLFIDVTASLEDNR